MNQSFTWTADGREKCAWPDGFLPDTSKPTVSGRVWRVERNGLYVIMAAVGPWADPNGPEFVRDSLRLVLSNFAVPTIQSNIDAIEKALA